MVEAGVETGAGIELERVRLRSRLPRLSVVTAVVAGWVLVGFLLGLDPNVYLLTGVPLVVAFQLLVARRPLRRLWLRGDRPWSRRASVLAALLALAPVVQATSGVVERSPVLVAYAVAAAAGAVPCGWALDALLAQRGGRWRSGGSSAVGATLVAGLLLVLGGVASGRLGVDALPGAATTVVLSFALYLPVSFVVEEVAFRGAFDSYVTGPVPTPGESRWTSVLVSALWGLWHLPVVGVATVGQALAVSVSLLLVHVSLGIFLTRAWRRSGNLALPALAHAAIDAVRNASLG